MGIGTYGLFAIFIVIIFKLGYNNLFVTDHLWEFKDYNIGFIEFKKGFKQFLARPVSICKLIIHQVEAQKNL